MHVSLLMIARQPSSSFCVSARPVFGSEPSSTLSTERPKWQRFGHASAQLPMPHVPHSLSQNALQYAPTVRKLPAAVGADAEPDFDESVLLCEHPASTSAIRTYFMRAIVPRAARRRSAAVR